MNKHYIVVIGENNEEMSEKVHSELFCAGCKCVNDEKGPYNKLNPFVLVDLFDGQKCWGFCTNRYTLKSLIAEGYIVILPSQLFKLIESGEIGNKPKSGYEWLKSMKPGTVISYKERGYSDIHVFHDRVIFKMGGGFETITKTFDDCFIDKLNENDYKIVYEPNN